MPTGAHNVMSSSASDLPARIGPMADSRVALSVRRLLSEPLHKNGHVNPGERQSRSRSLRMRKVSSGSQRSDSRPREFIHNVEKAIVRTQSTLRRSRLIHIFYILALVLYTCLGAAIFQALDGEYDDRLLEIHRNRCMHFKTVQLEALKSNCSGKSFDDCADSVSNLVESLDTCFRQWHDTHIDPTYSLSNFGNAFIFALSIYTTIGYGNIAAKSFSCRLATVFYAVFGIPLFFAFLKDMCNLFRHLFMKMWELGVRLRKALHTCICCHCHRRDSDADFNRIAVGLSLAASVVISPTHVAHADNESLDDPSCMEAQPYGYNRKRRLTDDSVNGLVPSIIEQRKVFIAALLFFIVYVLAASAVFSFMAEWDFFTAFYFFFHSVALIGFGDVFPRNPNIVLVNVVFIIIGVILFGMCYFILQEEIREKAYVASKRARISFSRYRNNLLQTNIFQDILSNGRGTPVMSNGIGAKRRRKSLPNITLHSVRNGTVTLSPESANPSKRSVSPSSGEAL